MDKLKVGEERQTYLVKEFVTFVHDEVLQLIDFEVSFSDELVDPAWGSADDVGRCFPSQELFIISYWKATDEGSGSDVLQVLSQSFELFLNLEGNFSGVG